MLVSSIFSFFHNVFKKPFPQGSQKWSLCAKGLIISVPGYDIGLEEESSAITNLHTLSNPDHIGQFQITGLSWNSTGAVIAASYPLSPLS